MKIEKCPYCGSTPEITKGVLPYFGWKWSVSCSPITCTSANLEHAEIKTLAIIKWNRWARREAKRIKQEERP